MKIQLLCLAILVCGVYTQTKNKQEESLVLHSSFPRQPVSCPKGEGFQYFWDGQKCEVCMNNCKCDSYLGCISCEDGYGKLFHTYLDAPQQKAQASCYRCDKEGAMGGSQYLISECCFQYSQQLDIKTTKIRSFMVAGQRAIKCRKSIMTSEVFGEKDTRMIETVIFQGGSVCWKVDFCRTYTEYGKCATCQDGYYQDENHMCQRCINGCERCSGILQCEICKKGFWLPQYWYQREEAKSFSESSFTELADVNPNECRTCRQNCFCTETSNNQCAGCLVVDGFFFNGTANTCEACSVQFCSKCPKAVGTCEVCKAGHVLIAGKCSPCPKNCKSDSCSVDKSGNTEKAVCNPDGCANGYLYTLSKMDCSTICPGEQARCELTNADETQQTASKPTQCRQDNPLINQFEGSDLQGWQTLENRLPIYDVSDQKNFFLIKQAGVDKCQDNKTLKCKKMKSPITDVETAECTECYTEFGYVLSPKKACIKCVEPHCTSCKFNGDNLQCENCMTGKEVDRDLHGQDGQVVDRVAYQNYIAVSGKCQACTEGCLQCDQTKNCSKGRCQNGYRSSTDISCEMCTEKNCKKCDDNKDICTSCFDGWRVWNSSPPGKEAPGNPKCEQCETGCLKCDSDRKVCTLCDSTGFLQNADNQIYKYYLFEGVCRLEKDNCVAHNPDGSCMTCKYGFRNVQGFCYGCYEEGYVNCSEGCSSERYTRDGDVLTAAYYKRRMDERFGNLSGNIISSAIAVILSVFLLFP